MPEPMDPNNLPPGDPMATLPPPVADPTQPAQQEVVEHARRAAGGSLDVGDLGDVAEGVVDVAAGVMDAVDSDTVAGVVEVGASVVTGAFDALGSGGEVLGGCAEGCSVMIAFAVLLAGAGTALACGFIP